MWYAPKVANICEINIWYAICESCESITSEMSCKSSSCLFGLKLWCFISDLVDCGSFENTHIRIHEQNIRTKKESVRGYLFCCCIWIKKKRRRLEYHHSNIHHPAATNNSQHINNDKLDYVMVFMQYSIFRLNWLWRRRLIMILERSKTH